MVNRIWQARLENDLEQRDEMLERFRARASESERQVNEAKKREADQVS
jgi:hypothetical protein